MTAHADLAEVRAALDLAAKATPGPWSSEDGSTTWGDDADLWSRIRDASGAVVSDMFEVTGRPHRQVSADAAAIVALRNAAPAISAAVEELTAARAEIARQRETIRAGADAVRSANASTTEIGCRLDDAGERIAALERQVCRLVSGQEIDGDRLCQHHGADVAALALLADERAAHAETSRDLDALLTALGAEVTPGGQTMDACHARRVADGMRRAAGSARDLEVYAEGKVTAKRTRSAERSFGRARTALRAAIAAEIERGLVSARARFDCARSVFFNDMLRRRNITSPCQECEGYGVLAYPSSATWRRGAGGQMSTYDVCDRCWGSGDAVKHGVDQRRLGAEIERARAEGRAESPAAPAPVARPISEWHEDSGSALWWRFPIEEPPYSGSPLDSDWPGYHTHRTPIVCPDDPQTEADADPASRGPIGGGS